MSLDRESWESSRPQDHPNTDNPNRAIWFGKACLADAVLSVNYHPFNSFLSRILVGVATGKQLLDWYEDNYDSFIGFDLRWHGNSTNFYMHFNCQVQTATSEQNFVCLIVKYIYPFMLGFWSKPFLGTNISNQQTV